MLPNKPYVKGWFSNKCSIIGSNGIINLSVPLQGGRNQKIAIKNIKIDYIQNWQQQHLKAISSCYGNAPYFHYYIPYLEKFYSLHFDNLFELNEYGLKMILSLLKKKVNLKSTEDYINPGNVFYTKQFDRENEIKNDIRDYYPQVFEDRLGFTANLSIIDIIMCMGPETFNILG
jgi:hypothetical protein